MLAELGAGFLVFTLAILGGTLVGMAIIQLVLFPAIEALDRWAARLWKRPPNH
jgi:hypothetical protein